MAPPVVYAHLCTPEDPMKARMRPSPLPTMTVPSGATAGEEKMEPPVALERQRRTPVMASIACRRRSVLPTKTVKPSALSAGLLSTAPAVR